MRSVASSRRRRELGTIGARLNEKVTGRALLLVEVIRCLRRVAGGAEGSRRCELRDRRARVARVASLMCRLGARMGGLRVGDCMTGRAGSVGGVMLGVAVLALRDRRRG